MVFSFSILWRGAFGDTHGIDHIYDIMSKGDPDNDITMAELVDGKKGLVDLNNFKNYLINNLKEADEEID